MLQKILFAAPAPLSTIVKGISPDLEMICHKCLQKDKNDRFQTASELAADLQRFINGEPVLARPVPKRVYLARSMKKNWQTLVPTLAVAGLAVLLVAQQKQSSESPEQSAGAVADAESGVPRIHVITEPEGASVAVIQCDSRTGEPQTSFPDGASELTPCDLELGPGRYRVCISLPEEGGLRTHVVHRTVPGKNGEWPSRTAGWERFQMFSRTWIGWPAIKIPPSNVTSDMVYIEGTGDFVVEGPSGTKTVSVAPFYVAPREFTFGDFVKLRPGAPGDVS
ncbi:MAG: hypothetical protein O2856_15345, partial [Planctomycetota bacterium]|nr:hypothetical protein [Planctomycetota bacterium]